MTVEDHAFQRAIRETFTEATSISDQRAMEYGDSWTLDQMHDGYLGQVLALPRTPELRREFTRLVRCAAIIDIKQSRLDGAYRQDTLIDLVNYKAAYLQWRAAYSIAVDKPMEWEGSTHGIRAYVRTGRACPGCDTCNG